MKATLSDKVIKRLTLYHFILTECINHGLEYISSPKISELLNIDNSQVRKDVKLLDNQGKCKVGYSVRELKESIEKKLGFKQKKDAFIMGAGNLGTALLKYDDFKDYGLNILAMFDNDPLKTGMIINEKEVFHVSKFPELVKKMNVEIGILTVPSKYAQDCADFMVKSGIKYIWNFAPRVLKAPKSVKVWNENLIGNFLQFIVNEDVRNEEK
ncbi:MAG: redox-sensing transcriptional repressor Rex [bacterium]|nr:redox-sensing transcriptional repressor Rex [bacterium]